MSIERHSEMVAYTPPPMPECEGINFGPIKQSSKKKNRLVFGTICRGNFWHQNCWLNDLHCTLLWQRYEHVFVCDLRVPLLCKWDGRSSGVLLFVDWYLPTFRDNLHVAYSRVKQPKKNEEWLERLTLEGGADRFSWNVRKELPV